MVGLVRAPPMVAELVALAPPVKPPVTIGTDQVYKVPAGTIPLVPFTGVTVKLMPVQLTVLIAVTAATGLTVTVNWNVAPVQLPVNGVTVYVALCSVFSGLVRVPNNPFCVVPNAPPVIPPVTIGATQLYVVPAGITPLVTSVGVTLKNTPLQLTAVIAVTDAFGLTVTVNWNADPLPHAAVFGVTVYVALCAVLVGLVNVPNKPFCAVADKPPVIPPVTIGTVQV